MALTITPRGTLYDTASNNSGPYTETQTWTPGANSLLVAFVSSGSSQTDPTVGGHGLTWTALTPTGTGASGTGVNQSTIRRIWCYVASSQGASPTSAGFNAQWGVAQTNCTIQVYEVTGADLSGGATGAIVQCVCNVAATGTGSITLSAAGNVLNRPMSFWSHNANEGTTPQTNWTEDSSPAMDGNYAAPNAGNESQHRDDAFDTAAAATWTSSTVPWLGIAIEIKASLGSLFRVPSLDGAANGGPFFGDPLACN